MQAVSLPSVGRPTERKSLGNGHAYGQADIFGRQYIMSRSMADQAIPIQGKLPNDA
jgi:hypothetical protein